METLYFLSKCNSQMLNKIGKMTGVVHQKVHLGRAAWSYLSRVIAEAIGYGPTELVTKNNYTITNAKVSL